MSDYLFYDMEEKDIDGVVELEKLSFKTPWSRNDFEAELLNNRVAVYRVLKEDEKVIAYGGMWVLFNEAHITNIAVHPSYRGRGFGNLLLEDLMNKAKYCGMSSMTLEVREGNLPALNLYKKYGFVEVSKRPKYYSDTNEDAIIMWKYEL